ncbi:MAG TPA: hypothetical protein VG818_13090 [Gemmatimonadaceae bacterium]|nr:hypothetical protein [Gemmatimonadaceae bacterium]
MTVRDLRGTLYHWRKRALNAWRMRARRTLILQPCLGGLGDTLFMSHLPRIAKQTGRCSTVLISSQANYRDPAYRTLVWERNPYVDGFTDASGLDIVVSPLPREGCNLLDEYMFLAGLDDGERFHEPEVHGQFAVDDRWRGAVVYDPNYITNAGALTPEMVQAFLAREGVTPTLQLAPRSRSLPLPGVVPTVTTRDVFEFCSLIVSCERLYCLTTGTATLAAALGKPATVLYGAGVDARFHHSRLHRYVRLG